LWFDDPTQPGTLSYFARLLNFKNIANVKGHMNEIDDFTNIVLRAYVTYLGIKKFQLTQSADMDLKEEVFFQTCSEIVEEYTQLSKIPPFADEREPPSQDQVYEYTKTLLHYLLAYEGFEDAIKYGDGLRVYRYYKFYLPHLRIYSSQSKMADEAIYIQLQHDFLMTEFQRHQLLWERFINTKGLSGHNIPADLHIEHINGMYKSWFKVFDIWDPLKLIKVSLLAEPLQQLVLKFDESIEKNKYFRKRKRPSSKEEMETILKELKNEQVGEEQLHRTFHTNSGFRFQFESVQNTLSWIQGKLIRAKLWERHGLY